MLDQDVCAFAQLSCRLAFDQLPIKFPEVLYMHGLSDGMIASCGLFEAVVREAGMVSQIAFNGDPAEHANTIGWAGVEEYRRQFINRHIPGKRLLPTAPGLHTRSECDEFLVLAKKHGFKTVGIATVPYHWPRVMACLVGSMAKHEYRLRAWFLRPRTVNWNQPMVGSQGMEKNSTFLQEAAGDVQRFCTYLERGREDEGIAWKTRYGAPIDEIMKYLDWRDGTAD